MPNKTKNLSPDSWIGLTQCVSGNTINTGYFQLTLANVLDPSFCFLLNDHHENNLVFQILKMKKTCFDEETELFEVGSSSIHLESTINPNPFLLQRTLVHHEHIDVGLSITKCTETEDSYYLDVNVRGVRALSLTGNQIYFSLF